MSRVGYWCLVVALAMVSSACAVEFSAISVERVATAASAVELAAEPIGTSDADSEPEPFTIEVDDPPPLVALVDDEPSPEPTKASIIESGLNEAAAWDQLMLVLYNDAGGFGRSVGEFAVAAGGACLGLVSDEQTVQMFPGNAALGKAVRDLSDEDCELLSLSFGGREPTGIDVWDEMVAFRFSRTVSFGTFDEFADLASLMCSTGLAPSAMNDESVALSTSVDFELQGLYYSDECALLDTSDDRPTNAAADVIFVQSGVNSTDISVVDLEAGTTTRIVDDGVGAAVSPDGQQVAYVRNRVVWVVQADGTGERRVSPPGAVASDPVWSPSGDLFFIEENSGPKPALTVGDIADGLGCDWPGYRFATATRNVTDYEADTGFGLLSRNGERVVWRIDGRLTYFEQSDCNTAEIKAIDIATGASATVLDLPSGSILYPNFSVSPIDDRLAINGVESTVPEVGVLGDLVNTDSQLFIEQPGGELIAVEGIKGLTSDLAWSPDGQWVAFVYKYRIEGSQFEYTLYVVSADGQDLRTLAPAGDAPIGGMHYRWSPDSTELAYSSRTQGQRGATLNVVDLAGNSREIGSGAPVGWR